MNTRTSCIDGDAPSASTGMNAPARPAETTASAAVNSIHEWAGGNASPVVRRIRRSVWATADPGGASTHGRSPTSASDSTSPHAVGTTTRYGSSTSGS